MDVQPRRLVIQFSRRDFDEWARAVDWIHSQDLRGLEKSRWRSGMSTQRRVWNTTHEIFIFSADPGAKITVGVHAKN
jgi:hypothetical protein